MTNETITNTLLKMKSEILGLPSIDELMPLMNKYEIVFSGSKYNHLSSHELFHYLKSKEAHDFSEEEFLKTIPSICNSLGMKTEPYVYASDISTNKTVGYLICLF